MLMALEFLSKIPISSIYQVLEPRNDFTPTLIERVNGGTPVYCQTKASVLNRDSSLTILEDHYQILSIYIISLDNILCTIKPVNHYCQIILWATDLATIPQR